MSLSTQTRAETARLVDQALGAEIVECLNDPKVEDTFINDGSTFVRYAGHKVKLKTVLTPAARMGVIGFAGTLIGQRADGVVRFTVDGKLPRGQRFHGVIPPRAVGGAYIVMRNPPKTIYTLARYVDDGVMSKEVADGLEKALADQEKILINGETGAGKTSLLTCLINHPVSRDMRTALLEDAEEVNMEAVEDKIVKSTLGGTMRELVFDAMRERPDRIIIGELRDGAAWDWIKAIETGHKGSMSSIHAQHPHTSMGRLERLCAEVLGESASSQRDLLIEMVTRLVPIVLLPNGKRHVPGVYAPTQFCNGRYQVSTICGTAIQATV